MMEPSTRTSTARQVTEVKVQRSKGPAGQVSWRREEEEGRALLTYISNYFLLRLDGGLAGMGRWAERRDRRGGVEGWKGTCTQASSPQAAKAPDPKAGGLAPSPRAPEPAQQAKRNVQGSRRRRKSAEGAFGRGGGAC
jgi:hypothetical protein